MPATLATMSIAPWASTTPATAARTASGSVTSHWTMLASPVVAAGEAVPVAPGDDRLQRQGVGRLEHEVRRAGRRSVTVLVELDDSVGDEVLGAGRVAVRLVRPGIGRGHGDRAAGEFVSVLV